MLDFDPVKKWFGFNRQERRGSFILLLIVILVLLIRTVVPLKDADIEDITPGVKVLAMQDRNPGILQPSSFDPNSATLETLLNIGFEEREARTLISYRNNGGRFRNPEDLKKVYGMEDGKAEKLLPYIRIGADTINKNHSRSKAYEQSAWQRKVIDLNNCDSANLEALPGIGPVLSARIIKYRNLLGGFASVDQLREVYGLSPETFEMLKTRVMADSSAVEKVSVNKADYKELARFPYLKSYEVDAILKYRELQGRISGMSALVENKILTNEKAEKVKAYLKFE
jgi:competence protein ComEA